MNLPMDLTFGVDPEKPTIPGCYVVWMLGAYFPVTLCWNGVDGYWRRGALRVQVEWWAGPLPRREDIVAAVGEDLKLKKKGRW